jgi:ribonuclease P protein component
LSPVGRVRARESLVELRRDGRRARSGPLWVDWLPAGDEPDAESLACLAFAIGRPVGPAVVRNRLRRRLRAIVRALAPGLAPGVYLIGARPPAAIATYKELETHVTSALRQLGACS